MAPFVRERRLIVGLSLLGLAITASIYGATLFLPFSETPSRAELFVGGVSIVLCPPSLLTIPLFDADPHTTGGAALWLVIGLLNSALYAAIGALILLVRRKSERL